MYESVRFFLKFYFFIKWTTLFRVLVTSSNEKERMNGWILQNNGLVSLKLRTI